MSDTAEMEFEIETETNRRGMTTTTDYKLSAVPGGESDGDLITALRSLIKKRDCSQLTHILTDMDVNDGDRVTLGEVLDHEHDPDQSSYDNLRTPDFDADDVIDELRLVRFDVTDLSVGDVIEVVKMGNDGPEDPKRGVVRDISPGDDWARAQAEISWDGHHYSHLSNDDQFRSVRIGRGNMMGQVYEINVLAPEDVTDSDLIELRESVLEAAEIDEQAEELTVETEKTWETGGAGESDRATEQHARVTVSGPILDDPVTVHCRNIWDFGWVANVKADLDDETERIVTAAARNNSPISTRPRL